MDIKNMRGILLSYLEVLVDFVFCSKDFKNAERYVVHEEVLFETEKILKGKFHEGQNFDLHALYHPNVLLLIFTILRECDKDLAEKIFYLYEEMNCLLTNSFFMGMRFSASEATELLQEMSLSPCPSECLVRRLQGVLEIKGQYIASGTKKLAEEAIIELHRVIKAITTRLSAVVS